MKSTVTLQRARFVTICWLLALVGGVAWADEADVFFDDSYVHEIRIYFADPNWYSVLYNSHANDPDDPYFPADFECQGVVLDSVGVRFKGNSSFGIPTVKKSLKIDFDEYDEDNPDLHFLGLKKLNLNNGFKDPTLLREKLFLDFADQFTPTIRAVHARVYINDVYWGLYTAVEQVDKTFVQSRFGDSEDGNLFKAAASDDGNPQDDFGSDLTYLGPNPEPYYDYYQLKTNETENDYSQLITFIDVLNNTPAGDLPAQLEPIGDVWGGLIGLALNCLFVNLDAYNGAAHNYYLYDRDDTGRITHIHWDANEAFGRFLMGVDPWDDPLEMDPFWLPGSMPGDPNPERPFMSNLWAVASYSLYYQNVMALMLDSGFDSITLGNRIHELADIIRSDVYADNNKMYSNSQFETNLTYDITEGGPGGGVIFGLEHFVQARESYLNGILPSLDPVPALCLNEVMAVNEVTLADEHGDYDDWVEVHNTGATTVDLAGYYVTDGNDDLYQIPYGHAAETTVPAGGFIVLWFDKETDEGPLHVAVKLDGDGEAVYLYAPDRVQTVDGLEFGQQYADASLIRFPDATPDLYLTVTPTPGAANELVEAIPGCTDPEALNYNPEANVDDGSCEYTAEPPVLFINEFMALNNSTIQDEAGQWEDWAEIFNPGPDDVPLGGLFLTDDLSNSTQWVFPDTTLPAGGFLLVWCDDDSGDGPLHATFKLSGGGEEIGLYSTLGTGNVEIDSYVFGAQTADVSEGRESDGGLPWVFFPTPTPGASNGSSIDVPGVSGFPLQLLPNYPNPFNPLTKLRFTLPSGGLVRLNIYDARGRLVASLKNEEMTAGSHEVIWNGCDDAGRNQASGVYFSRLVFGEDAVTGRLTLLR